MLWCTKYTSQVHGMLEMGMHCHEHLGPSFQHLACKHQDLLSGPPGGVSSTGSPHKTSAPDPVHSGCLSTDFLQFIGIFSVVEQPKRGIQQRRSSTSLPSQVKAKSCGNSANILSKPSFGRC